MVRRSRFGPKRASGIRLPQAIRIFARNRLRIALILTAAVFVLGLLLPENLVIPVKDAKSSDWNHSTFWSPWGAPSGVHKGIDIFAPEGKAVITASAGIVVYTGWYGIGGNVFAILGPKWRIHYYAHLRDVAIRPGRFLSRGDQIGTVGTTGNAAGKQPHIHYTIITMIPYVWRIDGDQQGWKQMFYLNPHTELLRTEIHHNTNHKTKKNKLSESNYNQTRRALDIRSPFVHLV